MKILFIHQNFPGQFKNLAPELASKGYDVSALFPERDVPSSWMNVDLKLYKINRSNADDGHPWITDFESKIIRAEACFNKAMSLRKRLYARRHNNSPWLGWGCF